MLPQIFARLAQYTSALVALPEMSDAVVRNARLATVEAFETLASSPVVLTYASPVVINADLGSSFRLTPTNGAAITFGDPSPMVDGQMICITIINTFGVLGAVTFGANTKIGAAWTQPANGHRRTIWLECDGTYFHEVGRTAADVTN